MMWHPGLINTGNTCYLNTAIQMLFSLPGVQSALLKWEIKEESDYLEKLMAQNFNEACKVKFCLTLRDIFRRMKVV